MPPANAAGPAIIQVRADRVSQLFDALDPLPLTERDLSETTERFIVGWARELPRRQPLRIVVHVPPDGAAASQRELDAALRHHFRYRADRISSDLKELFRIGRLSLAIGIAVLAACILTGQWLTTQASANYLTRFFNEGLIIVGWVANWRPIEIFLSDWWPLLRQRALYRRLAEADIRVQDATA
jgi:hypothetical protein